MSTLIRKPPPARSAGALRGEPGEVTELACKWCGGTQRVVVEDTVADCFCVRDAAAEREDAIAKGEDA
jgi:hypothetical protein